jgi:hypothetical protein
MRDVFASPPPRFPPNVVDPDQWITHVFSAQAAAKGGVVRRQARDVERILGWDRLRVELQRRGYRAVVNGRQVVNFCNAEPVRLFE